ncbi:MAG: sigma-70 family RNA polymerase sigma factor [Saccharothrix sp.]|nr:sigma-70 family RNA polymerase sigma factor [Saccharothrix sp.]
MNRTGRTGAEPRTGPHTTEHPGARAPQRDDHTPLHGTRPLALVAVRAGDETDDDLAEAVRAGELGAFSTLYDRHVEACLRFARYLGASDEVAEDVVAESFTRIFVQLVRGKGPTTAFRSYAFSAVRANLINAVRRDHRQDLAGDPEASIGEAEMPIGDLLESIVLARALAALPGRWQEVLWRVEVEGETPATLAERFGMTPNAVAALTYRAREGLRAAYLQAHVQNSAEPGCGDFVPKLSAWMRHRLREEERRAVDDHLRVCGRCSAAVADLAGLADTLDRPARPSTRPAKARRHGGARAVGGVAVLLALTLLAPLLSSVGGPDQQAAMRGVSTSA